jgi:ABC-type amino acid transport substrate-binding protein
MKTNKKYSLLFRSMAILMIFSSLLALAGCGSSNSAAPTSPAAPASSLDEVKAKGKLVIGTSGNFSPVTFVNDKGELDGIDIALGKLVAKELGVEAEFVTGNLNSLIPGLQSGQFDVLMSGFNATEERKQIVDFSVPYMIAEQIAATQASNTTAEGLTGDFSGLIVGAISGTPQSEWLQKKGGYKELKEYPGNAEAFTDLKMGRFDMYMTNRIVIADFIKRDTSPNPLKMVGEPTQAVAAGIAMRKDEPELKAEIDAAITKLAASGELDRIGETYVGYVLPRELP